MSDLAVGRVELCPKVCCGGEVDINTITKRINEALGREIDSTKGSLEEDENNITVNINDIVDKTPNEVVKVLEETSRQKLGEKQAEKQPIYVITYECGKEIKQEKIVVESLEEVMDIITDSDFVGFHTVNGKLLYIKAENILEIREYDEKQDELVKLTPEVKIKLPNEKDDYNLSKEEMAFMLASILIQRCKQ